MKRNLSRRLKHFNLFLSQGIFAWVILLCLPGEFLCQGSVDLFSSENSTVTLKEASDNMELITSERHLLYQKKLILAMKFTRCFSNTGSEIPRYNSSSHLIAGTKCSSNECEKCLKEVQDCETQPHLVICRQDSDSKNLEPHKADMDHDGNTAPNLAFHCNKANKSGTYVNFRMEYENPSTLEKLEREHLHKIPRVFVVEQLGETYDVYLTVSWMFSYLNGTQNKMWITPVSPSVLYEKLVVPSLHFNETDDEAQKPTITHVQYDPLTVGKGETKLLVRWTSGRGSKASCSAKVYFLDNDDPDFFMLERKEPQNAFWAEILVKLSFGMSYTINVVEQIIDLEVSGKETFDLITKTCAEIHNHSFSHCPPPKPLVKSVIKEQNGGLLISWSPPPHTNILNQVLYYNLTISSSQIFIAKSSSVKSGPAVGGQIPALHSLPTIIYHEKIPGNETTWSIRTKNVTFTGKIEVSIQATSLGGKSEMAIKAVEIHEGDEPDGMIYQKILMTTLCVVLVMIIVLVGVLLKYRRDKLKRKKQLHEYFEKLDKESIHIKPSVDRYSSKWEIPSGDLILGDVIGEGAFGLVRKAVMYKNGHKIIVAVKTLRDGVDENDSEKFWEEFNILKGLDPHKHVVGLVGIVKAHVPALVVEYCHGGDLQTHLRKASQSRANLNGGRYSHSRSTSTNDSSSASNSEKRVRMSMVTNEAYFINNLELEERISELDLLSYGRQVACGMEFLSSNKIVHRDLAARNVLIGPNRTLKIADFGLSRDVYEQNWYKKNSNGKIPIKWLAIECLLQEVYTTKSDVWSFGILLWEIVTLGGNPYPGVENTRIFDLLKSGYRMPQPENCSDELYTLMRQCWQEKSVERPDFSSIKSKLDAIIEKSNFVVYMNLDLGSESPSYNTDEE